MKYLLTLCLALMALWATAQTAADTRVFEMRIYYAEPGKLDALVTRFQKHTRKLFKKHGMENIGYWLPLHNDDNRLIYILAYPDMAARDKAWQAFGEDPKWKKVKSKSEVNGKLVQKVESIFMNATDYSPLITPSTSGERVFELRIYTAAPEKLPNLNERFRTHTMKLFAKHGATNLAYWSTIEKEASVQPKLYYILAHPSEAGGAKMFEQFVNDPEWKRVKAESEKNGPIIDKIESVYMRALSFSPIK
jgi:hypothetical protein